MDWEAAVGASALPCVKQRVGTCGMVQGAQLSAVVAWMDGMMGEGRGTRIHTADSLQCTAETAQRCKAAIPQSKKKAKEKNETAHSLGSEDAQRPP